MKIYSILFSATATLATLGWGAAAKADMTDAHCDLYAPGEDYAYLSSNCTFSQRQGYIGIDLQRNNVRYELAPVGEVSGNFVDQHGYAVYRQAGLGDTGTIFEFVDGSHLYVYWDDDAAYGSAPPLNVDAAVATLRANDMAAQINVRSEPTIYAYAHSYGLVGDQVRILQCLADTDTATSDLNWCEVQFLESGITGWVRSDFISFPNEGFL